MQRVLDFHIYRWIEVYSRGFLVRQICIQGGGYVTDERVFRNHIEEFEGRKILSGGVSKVREVLE